MEEDIAERTLDSVEEDIAELRSKIQQPVEQQISDGGVAQNDKKKGQQEQTDIDEVESVTKRDHIEQHRNRKQKIRKEQKVLRTLKKAEGKKDVERRKKQRKGNVEQRFLDALDKVENGKRMKERIITREEKLPTDHTVRSVLEVKDKKENNKKNSLGQSLERLAEERKSDEATGLVSGEDQRVRWWRKQGFY